MKDRTRKSIEDGGARGMTPMKPHYTPMTHHSSVSAVATRMDLIGALQQFARFALDRSPDLTTKERQFLKDMCREDAHARGYGFGALDRLVELAVRTPEPHKLEEAIRGQVLQRMAPQNPCLMDRYLTETRKQSLADVEQAHLHVERTGPRRDATLQACHNHLEAMRLYIDALHLFAPTSRRHIAMSGA